MFEQGSPETLLRQQKAAIARAVRRTEQIGVARERRIRMPRFPKSFVE